MGDGESYVIAHILTTRLLGVADEAGLLVAPHFIRCSAQDQDAEDEQNGEPHFPHHGGMLLSLLKKLPQQVPVAHGCERSDRELRRQKKRYLTLM